MEDPCNANWSLELGSRTKGCTLFFFFNLFIHIFLQTVLNHHEPGYKDESYSLIFFSSLPPQHYWYWLYVTMSQDMEMKVTLLSSCLLFLHNISSSICHYLFALKAKQIKMRFFVHLSTKIYKKDKSEYCIVNTIQN